MSLVSLVLQNKPTRYGVESGLYMAFSFKYINENSDSNVAFTDIVLPQV